MIKDRIVRIKLIKRFQEQRPISYIGKVTAFSESWVVLDAYGVMLCRQESEGVQVDKRASAIMIPRENVESIQILPDNFDLENLKFTTEGARLVLVVDGSRDSFVGELGEG